MVRNEFPTRHMAWFCAGLFAILPAGAVAILTRNYADGAGHVAFNAAIAWGAAASLCVGVLRVWHSIAHGFGSFAMSTMAVITAIVGAFAGLIGAALASTETLAVIFFIAAFLGAFQGAAIAWFIVGPDLHAPPEMQSDAEEEDDNANPPTRAP